MTHNAPAVSTRCDKWLWASRFFKTRSLAAKACQSGKVLRQGVALKPASTIKPGETLHIQTRWLTREIRVLAAISRRVGAKAASECYEDLTPSQDIEAAEAARQKAKMDRPPGSGRPTKLERRDIEKTRDALRDLGVI